MAVKELAGLLFTAARHSSKATDAELVQQFSTSNDQAAFAALVERHGHMVVRVCRRLLHNPHDVDDAFQVTFLVLARQARSIQKRQAVASWLYGVARRTAVAARRAAARRRVHEGGASRMSPNRATDTLEWSEVQQAIEDELGRLPEKFRTPFVFCCLEGKNRADVARDLGIREGTISSRLARARKQLQERLAKRGIVLSAALAALALSETALPAGLYASTIRMAMKCATAGGMVHGVAPMRVAILLRTVLKSMVFAKCKTAVIIVGLLALGLGSAGAIYFATANPSRAASELSVSVKKTLWAIMASSGVEGPGCGG